LQIPTHTDIIVAGGGPAGSTIARLLANFSFRVVLLEKRRFPRHQIGESLTPQILPILNFLGVRQRVEDAGFLRMVGHTICWGSSHPRTSYYSTDHTRRGFQAWREDFDTVLLDHALHSSVQVIEEQTVESVRLDGDTGVTVHTRQGRIEASFFVDASGHVGVLARQGLRQRDETFQTLALTAYWKGAAGPTGVDFANTLLETYSDGLVWSVPLHNGLRNVTLLTDWYLGDRIRQIGLQQFYLSELQKAPYVSGFLKGAEIVWSPRAFDATWYTAANFAGERFLLAGDAGLFVDPLSSEGVHKAMASAITGAVVVNTILKRPTMSLHAIRFYDESQRNTYDLHYQQSARYYREEGRWPEHPFWQKRSRSSPESGVRSPESKNVPNLEPTASNPQSAIRNPQSLTSNPQSPTPNTQRVSHLYLAPGVRIEQRPVIEGSYVELREVMVAPSYPRGVRFLQDVCVPTLLRVVEAKEAVSNVIPAYLQSPEGRRCPPESVRQVLARLYQEGVLTLVN
jgi:flavin-dependent dehydrogenase